MFLRQNLFEPVSLDISLGSICELDIVINRELFTAGVTPKCAHLLGSRYRRTFSQLTFLNRDCFHRILQHFNHTVYCCPPIIRSSFMCVAAAASRAVSRSLPSTSRLYSVGNHGLQSRDEGCEESVEYLDVHRLAVLEEVPEAVKLGLGQGLGVGESSRGDFRCSRQTPTILPLVAVRPASWPAVPNTASAGDHCAPLCPTPSSARSGRAAACPA